MKKINDPFLVSFPYIDIHGYDREYAVIKVKEFINDCYKLGKYNLIIIHGKGKFILKNEVNNYLKNENLVIEFKIHNFNDGITIVKLKNNDCID